MAGAIRNLRDLKVFCGARDAAMRVYEVSRAFPAEERYALTDQVRRASRSVCANLAEAWHRRRYPAAFRAKLLDCAAEAEETRVWIDFAFRCGFLKPEDAAELDSSYTKVLGQLLRMSTRPEDWSLR